MFRNLGPVCAQGNAPGHDLGEALGVAGLAFRLGVAVRVEGLVGAQVVLVAGPQGVEQLVGDDHQVALPFVVAGEYLDHPDHAFPQAEGMVQVRGEGRVVVKHEQADLRPRPRCRVVAPGPPAQVQAPPADGQAAAAVGEGRRQGVEGWGQVDGQGLQERAAMALYFLLQPFPEGGEVTRARLRHGLAGEWRTVGGDRVEGDVDGVLPVGGPGVAAPGPDGHGGEDEQQDPDAQFAEHGGGGRRRSALCAS